MGDIKTDRMLYAIKRESITNINYCCRNFKELIEFFITWKVTIVNINNFDAKTLFLFSLSILHIDYEVNR